MIRADYHYVVHCTYADYKRKNKKKNDSIHKKTNLGEFILQDEDFYSEM